MIDWHSDAISVQAFPHNLASSLPLAAFAAMAPKKATERKWIKESHMVFQSDIPVERPAAMPGTSASSSGPTAAAAVLINSEFPLPSSTMTKDTAGSNATQAKVGAEGNLSQTDNDADGDTASRNASHYPTLDENQPEFVLRKIKEHLCQTNVICPLLATADRKTILENTNKAWVIRLAEVA